MKVLYVTTMYPTPEYPQKGIFCHEQVKAINELGVDIDVVVPVPYYEKLCLREWYFEGIHIRYIRFFKLFGARDFHRTGKALFHALNHRIKLGDYDLFHADCALPSGQAVMLASKLYDIPFIVHGHGLDVFLDVSYSKEKNCKKIVDKCKEVYEAADSVIGVSQKVIDNIQKRVDITKKAYVVYNGVDTEKFFPLRNKPKSNKLRLVSIGNLIELKGHDYTIRAVKKLIDEGFSDVCLTIAGRGEMAQELKQLVDELDLNKVVRFTGYISYESVIKLLQTSDVFVLPSWYEALGCVYLEAMACDLPVIGCYNCGIDEIIVNGRNGFLVMPKDVNQLFLCIKQCFCHSSINKISREGLLTVRENYKWSDSAEALLQIYTASLN